ncbi:MAG: PAS domain-containing protein, partial [Deltaproteobacteria bacterium]
MAIPPPEKIAISSKYNTPLLIALIVAGLAGNYFKYPIFLNIDFLFGSIFAMLVLQFLGLGRGIAAAVMIASYTYILWNHPYAIVILTVEVAVVGLLMDRRKLGMVLADTLFWVFIGMPLGYIFYHIFLHTVPNSTYFIVTKQAMNGIANALAARLIFTGFTLYSRSSLISFREILYNLLSFFVLCPALLLLMSGSRTDFAETDHRVKESLADNVKHEDFFLDAWVSDRQSTIVNLAQMAATRTPQQMQAHFELVAKSDNNFSRIALLNKEATSTAYYPQTDELGRSTVGKSFADRQYLLTIKQTLKPMLSNIELSLTGSQIPRVAMIAPIVVKGQYSGLVAGILSLEQIKRHLDKSFHINNTLYTLLDGNGNIIMTSRDDQKIMAPLQRGKGIMHKLDNGISQWLPTLPPNTPVTEKWIKSFYVAEIRTGKQDEWKLILEQPVAPFQKALYRNYTVKFIELFLILLVALLLAEFLIRRLITTHEKLQQVSRDIPFKLATSAKIDWPESRLLEINNLIINFKETTDSLATHFYESEQINESLELQVEKRTKELRESEFRWQFAIEGSGDGVWDWNTQTNEAKYSKRWKEMLGYAEHDKPVHQEWVDRIHPDDQQYIAEQIQAYLNGETSIYLVEYRFRCKDESYKWILARGAAVERSEDGKVLRMIGTHTDITKRKQAEEALQRYQNMLTRSESITHVGSWEWDATTRSVTWSEGLFRILHRDPADGAPSFEEQAHLYHPE